MDTGTQPIDLNVLQEERSQDVDAFLRVVSPEEIWRLHRGVNIVGRRVSQSENEESLRAWQLQYPGMAVYGLFLDNKTISLQHAAIFLEATGDFPCRIKDLASTNKTWLGRAGTSRMTILDAQDRYTIASGSRVKFGELECEIHFKFCKELQETDDEAIAAPSALEVDDQGVQPSGQGQPQQEGAQAQHEPGIQVMASRYSVAASTIPAEMAQSARSRGYFSPGTYKPYGVADVQQRLSCRAFSLDSAQPLASPFAPAAAEPQVATATQPAVSHSPDWGTSGTPIGGTRQPSLQDWCASPSKQTLDRASTSLALPRSLLSQTLDVLPPGPPKPAQPGAPLFTKPPEAVSHRIELGRRLSDISEQDAALTSLLACDESSAWAWGGSFDFGSPLESSNIRRLRGQHIISSCGKPSAKSPRLNPTSGLADVFPES